MDLSSKDLGALLLIGANGLLVALVLFVFYVLQRALSRRDAALAATAEQFASISEQLAALRRLVAQAPAAAPADDTTPLLAVMAELDPEQLSPIDQALSQSLGLVGSVQTVAEADYPAWKAAHQGEIDALLARREQLERDVAELKDKLTRAHKLVATLHAKNRRLGPFESEAQHLAVMNNSLSEELAKAKQQRRELEQELEQQYRLSSDKHAELVKTKGLLQLQAQQQETVRQQLQAEIDSLNADLLKERDILSRTLVEKDFIETVYVETDASLDELKRLQAELLQLSQDNQALRAQLQAAGGARGAAASASPATPPR